MRLWKYIIQRYKSYQLTKAIKNGTAKRGRTK